MIHNRHRVVFLGRGYFSYLGRQSDKTLALAAEAAKIAPSQKDYPEKSSRVGLWLTRDDGLLLFLVLFQQIGR